MKNAKVENKKIVKAVESHRGAGVHVRSGINAGFSLGDKEFGTKQGGEFGKPGSPGDPGSFLG